MHCRICDDEYEARELSGDQCCFKCVEASSNLYDAPEDDSLVAILLDDTSELDVLDEIRED